MISKEEYGKIRTVEEFIAWVESSPDKDSKKSLWVKKFNQEAWPLKYFLEHKEFPANTKIQLDTVEDSFDALIIPPATVNGEKKMKFQIVSTDSEESILMEEDLRKHGMAWLPTSVNAKGNFKKWDEEDSQTLVEDSIRSKNQIVHENIDQIISRINKKISKKYADKLYLLVSFNDFFLANMPENVIKKFVAEKILPNDSFIKIYLASEHKLVEL